ncbi:MAG: methyltransferase domain-containing protein [Oligoflexia bacterium]|nr:methyltransferase domain-containing protein [Oligoflexia bacterium]
MGQVCTSINNDNAKSNITLDVKNFFHHYAENFDALYGHTKKRNFFYRWLDRNFRKVMRSRFEETIKNTADPQIRSVLDVGCGPGRYCVEFLKQNKENVVGIDMAKGMLEIARSITNQVSTATTVNFILGDYLSYRFDRKFDAACLMGFFDYIENPVEILQKLKQDVRMEIYASFPKSSGLLAKYRILRYRIRGCPLYLYSLNELMDILRRSGLKDKAKITHFDREYYVKIKL